MSIATTSFSSFNYQKPSSGFHNKSSLPWILSTKLEYHTSRRLGTGLLCIRDRRRRSSPTVMIRDLNAAVNNISSVSSTPPSGSPFPGWSSWLLLTIVPLIIPLLTNKWGPLTALKHKMDSALETVENITETIEAVARGVDTIADEVTENLPKDSKFRKIIERIDQIAEETIKGADGAQELLQMIEDTAEQVEDAIKVSAVERAENTPENESAEERAKKAEETPEKESAKEKEGELPEIPDEEK